MSSRDWQSPRTPETAIADAIATIQTVFKTFFINFLQLNSLVPNHGPPSRTMTYVSAKRESRLACCLIAMEIRSPLPKQARKTWPNLLARIVRRLWKDDSVATNPRQNLVISAAV